jgi:hypothetical protein
MREETPFLSVFTKKTNFITQTFNTDFKRIAFGGSGTFTLPRHGDFVTRIFACIVYESAKSTGVTQGHAMIEYAELQMGGQTIQRETGETLNMRVCLTNQEQESYSIAQLYRMLGGGPGASFVNTDQYPRPYTLMVPLEFYFNGNTSLALPLTALRFQEVDVVIGFREASRWGGTDAGVTDAKVYLQVEYGYVDAPTLKSIISKPLFFPVEQFQFQEAGLYQGDTTLTFPDRDPSRSTGVPFSNPVKAIFCLFQSTDFEVGNVFDYTRGFKYSRLTDLQGNDFLKTMEFELDGGTLVPEMVGTVEFLRGYQYYAYFPGATQSLESGDDRLYSYIYALSFCRDPMNRHVINGSLNFSTIRNSLIRIKAKGAGGNVTATKTSKGIRNKGIHLDSVNGISVGDYLRSKNVKNDATAVSIEPTMTVFYNELGGTDLVISEHARALNLVEGTTLTFSDLTTGVIATVPSGSGSLGTIHQANTGDSFIVLSSMDTLPIAGDPVNTSGETQTAIVSEVKGGLSSFIATSLTTELTGNVYFSTELTGVVDGMFVAGASVQSDTLVSSIYESISEVTGNPVPVTVLGAISITGFDTVSVADPSYLYVGAKVFHVNLPKDTTIISIIGTTVTLSHKFNTYPDITQDGGGMIFFIPHISLDKPLTASPVSETITIYPVVTLTGNVVGTPSGQVKFGDVVVLAGGTALSKTGDTLTATNLVEMSLDAVDIVTGESDFTSHRSSSIRTRLYALSTNFLIIDGGVARLAYKGSEISLPRFT